MTERESCGLVGWLLDGRKASFGHSVGWFLLSWNSFFGGFLEILLHQSLAS